MFRHSLLRLVLFAILATFLVRPTSFAQAQEIPVPTSTILGTGFAYVSPQETIRFREPLARRDTLLYAHPIFAASNPAWSPDGTQVAFSATPRWGGDCTIVVLSLETGAARELSPFEVKKCKTNPSWSPDGARIAYFVALSNKYETVMSRVQVVSVNASDGANINFHEKFLSPGGALESKKISWRSGEPFMMERDGIIAFNPGHYLQLISPVEPSRTWTLEVNNEGRWTIQTEMPMRHVTWNLDETLVTIETKAPLDESANEYVDLILVRYAHNGQPIIEDGKLVPEIQGRDVAWKPAPHIYED